jgi:putative DNA primase/helicase
MALKNNGSNGQDGAPEREERRGASSGRRKSAKPKHTHVSWSPTGEPNLECTPTGRTQPHADGNIYAEVVGPDGQWTWVIQSELITLEEARRRMSAGAQKNLPRLSADDMARLDTWALELAAQVHGTGREEGNGDYRFGHSDRLVVHRTGLWHDFAANQGGHGALALLAHLHGSAKAAATIGRAWLTQHTGDGRLGRDPDEDDEAEQSLLDAEAEAYIDALWFRAQSVTDSAQAMSYFANRGLDVVSTGAASQLRWLPDWRGNEGVILAYIGGGAGELVALQLLHIRPDGSKSEVQPARKILKGPSNWRQRGAFRLGGAGSVHLVEVEGIEDAIAAVQSGAERVHACCGAGAIGRAELPSAVTRVTAARDDDPPGSSASLALGRGVARIMLQGRSVSVTPRAGALHKGAKDLNDLLQVDAQLARRQIDEADGLKHLDSAEKDALLDHVSRAPRNAYETNRRMIAKALNWRAGALDQDRAKRCAERKKQGGDDPVAQVGMTEPWPDPVLDIGAVLDAAVAQMKRFLILSDPAYYDAAALWAAHCALVHRPELEVGYTPRLAFQSPLRRCGKSTGLKCVHLMAHNSRMAASISPSSLFRAIDAFQISLTVDEGDNVFKDPNSDLLAIMNAGADRLTAKVMRSEKNDDGKFEPREFNCFAPVALTSIRELPETLQDRSIVVPMRRAMKHEKPVRLTLRTRGPLIDIGRQFTRWAADLKELPDPNLPADLFNRVEDRWFVLFQIAHLAEGGWPEQCRKAALVDLAREEASDADGGIDNDLLNSVWEVFHAKKVVRIFTKEICAALAAMSEAPWGTANRGQPVNEYYLKTHLKNFLPVNPDEVAPRKWMDQGVQLRGFHQKHFEDAFARYLGKGLPCPSEHQNQAA